MCVLVGMHSCVHALVCVCVRAVFYSKVFLLKLINQHAVKMMLTKLIPFKA